MIVILNIISILATFIVAVGIIYFILNLVFGNLSFLNRFVVQEIDFKLKHLLFFLFGLIFLFACFTFYQPWH